MHVNKQFSTSAIKVWTVKPIPTIIFSEDNGSMHGSNELRLLSCGFCSKSEKAEHVSSAKLPWWQRENSAIGALFLKEEGGKVLLTCEGRNQCQSKPSIELLRSSSKRLYWNDSRRKCEWKKDTYLHQIKLNELINFTHVMNPGCQCNKSRTEPKQQPVSLTKLVFVTSLLESTRYKSMHSTKERCTSYICDTVNQEQNIILSQQRRTTFFPLSF